MSISSEDVARRWLESVGYYRLSAYWLPFEEAPEAGKVRSKKFKSGVTFESIYELYVFDRRLRILILEAIERIEIHVRSRWTYHMAIGHGSHAHLKHELYSNGSVHAKLLYRLSKAVDLSNETFVDHYRKKYSNPYSPPLWAITELISLGDLSQWVEISKDNTIKSKIGSELGLPTKEIVESVLHSITYVRNICAHHARLWNRRLVKRLIKIKRLKRDLVFVEDKEGEVCDNRIYNVLVLIMHIIDHQNTDSTWRERLLELIDPIPTSHLEMMGFPGDWRSRAVWKKR